MIVRHGVFGDKSEAAEGLNVPGYTMDLRREIVGSSQYINERLAPPDKKVRILLWSGDTAPNAEALEITERAGLRGVAETVASLWNGQTGLEVTGRRADGALRLCIGPEDAKQDPIREGRTEGDCTYTQVKRSGNTWTGRLTCKEPPSQGDFTTTLHSATHFTTKAALTSKEHGRIDMNTEARRLSADCGTLKPVAKPTPKR